MGCAYPTPFRCEKNGERIIVPIHWQIWTWKRLTLANLGEVWQLITFQKLVPMLELQCLNSNVWMYSGSNIGVPTSEFKHQSVQILAADNGRGVSEELVRLYAPNKLRSILDSFSISDDMKICFLLSLNKWNPNFGKSGLRQISKLCDPSRVEARHWYPKLVLIQVTITSPVRSCLNTNVLIGLLIHVRT